MKPIAWEAEDGTVFSSEAKCQEYEKKRCKKRDLKSRFYYQDGTRLSPEVEKDGESIYYRCWYVYIANEKEVDFVNEFLNTEDFTKPGAYLYDDEYGGFRHISELYGQIRKAHLIVDE